jgi:hypothetical protein
LESNAHGNLTLLIQQRASFKSHSRKQGSFEKEVGEHSLREELLGAHRLLEENACWPSDARQHPLAVSGSCEPDSQAMVLAFLAPELQSAILGGKQSIRHLNRYCLPLAWRDQARMVLTHE